MTTVIEKVGRAVIDQSKAMTIDDPILGRCLVRPDGRNPHEMLLMKIKRPSEAREPFDVAEIASVVPGDKAFGPMTDGGCPMASGSFC